MKRWVQLFVSLAITTGALWWTFKDADWAGMKAALLTANWVWLLPYLAILAFIHVCRVLRWGNLLSGLEVVPFRKLNEASAIGFMMLLVLPLRLGEFARPFLLAQRSKIRRSAAMPSVALERIVDGVSIAILLRALLFFVPRENANAASLRLGGNLMFLVFFGGFLFLLLAKWRHATVISLMRNIGNRISAPATEKAVHIVDGFVGALGQVPNLWNSACFVFWTICYWVANGVGVWIFAKAFDCSAAAGQACSPLSLSLFEAFVVLGALIIGLMFPAGPASAGPFQAAIKVGLAVFVSDQVVNSTGAAFANALWVVQIAQQVLTGMVFMVTSHDSFSSLTSNLTRSGKAEDEMG